MRISDWSSDVCSSDLEGVLGIILPAEIVEEETLARAAFGRDHKIIIVDARIEEVECDELTLAAHIEQGRAAASAKVGLDRRHQRCRLHRHPEIALADRKSTRLNSSH